MIGISVSLYDKFDDLGILLELVRKNWDGDYFVSVCSNHPNANKKIKPYSSDIDHFVQGAQIVADHSISGRSRRKNFLLRVNDTIRKSMKGALSQEEVTYVLHLHADAWPLSEQGILTLISEMKNQNASMGFKVGTEKFLNEYPPGHFMDQFMIFDADESRSVDIFQRDILDLPPGIHSHHLLPMTCLIKFGWNNLYHYSNRDEEILWDGTPTLKSGRRVRPMTYNPEYEQVHIAREAFRNNLGKSLQAYYLENHDIQYGDKINKLIDDHYLPREKLFSKLREYYADLDKELRWYYGISSESLGRATRDISEYTGLNFKERVSKFFEHHFRVLAWGTYERFSQIFNENDPWDESVKYRDLNEYYASIFDMDEFPEEYVRMIESIYK